MTFGQTPHLSHAQSMSCVQVKCKTYACHQVRWMDIPGVARRHPQSRRRMKRPRHESQNFCKAPTVLQTGRTHMPERWQFSRCENSARAERAGPMAETPGGAKAVAPLNAALLLAARGVPPPTPARRVAARPVPPPVTGVGVSPGGRLDIASLRA